MTHGALFAGIGGFNLSAQWAGIENVWANEIDPYCCRVLRKNFKGLKIYEQDIREIGKHNLEPVDIITGGFPCQPFSDIGKRKGKEDPRYLWPEMLRVISELMPSFVIGENVIGLKTMENGGILEGILIGLEDIRYQVETFLIPSASTGSWHRRERIWIFAHTCGIRWNKISKNNIPQCKKEDKIRTSISMGSLSDNIDEFRRRYDEPIIWRDDNELSKQLDERNKAIGNAIDPKVAYEIFKAIKDE